jgi:hypothetical protein
MMGTKTYQEKMFYRQDPSDNFSLSERVPPDHFLRKVDKVVNLGFVRKLVKPYYSYTGQPSIDLLFKMMLIGYFFRRRRIRLWRKYKKVGQTLLYPHSKSSIFCFRTILFPYGKTAFSWVLSFKIG